MSTPFHPTRFKLAYGGLIAIALAAGGRGAWLVARQNPRAALDVSAIVLCTLIAAFGLAALWMEPFLDDRPERALFQLPFGPKRMKRMRELLEFLPEETPPGWSPLVNPKGTVTWYAVTSDGVVILTWLVAYDLGYHLCVALAGKHGSIVSEARSAEILAHFRGVGPFMERDSLPDFIRERFPHAREWVALPYETIKKVPRPARPPAILDRPLNAHLLAVRKHFPTKLPEFWSVPLAVTEPRGEYASGVWIIEEDDVAFTVSLVSSRGRAKLAVTILYPEDEAVNEWRAYGILKHFRGVSEFAQTEDDGEIPGARMYLGEVVAVAQRPLLS
jgi:hypothetical protein